MNTHSATCARFGAAPLSTGGTSAADWLTAAPLPTLNLDECRSLVIVGAHPDDETLGFGGTAAYLAARGVDVTVVSASDGGAAHPGASSDQAGRLAQLRSTELRAAVATLGLGGPISLGLPDGRLANHEEHLADLLAPILADAGPGSWCAATWRGDGHPDHEAVGRAAATAAAAAGAPLLEFPVWMWHWARPGDPDVPWDRAFAIDLPAASVAVKEQAAQCFHSQFTTPEGEDGPVLPSYVLPRLLAVGEMVLRSM